MLLSIIIPAYNEEALIGELLRRVCAVSLEEGLGKEIIVVDDGSTDATRNKVRAYMESGSGIQLICHERNLGKGAAVRSGFACANGDILIIQDADLEYDPEDIRNVIRPIMRGETQVVYGSKNSLGKEIATVWSLRNHDRKASTFVYSCLSRWRNNYQVGKFSLRCEAYRRGNLL